MKQKVGKENYPYVWEKRWRSRKNRATTQKQYRKTKQNIKYKHVCYNQEKQFILDEDISNKFFLYKLNKIKEMIKFLKEKIHDEM